MSDARLKSLAERINRLLDEKKGLTDDIADIFQEAKSAGYVPKVLRKAITRQRMEPAKRQEEDSILELYEAALDGPTREAVRLAAQGATSRQIQQATGIDHVTVSRAVSLKKNTETPEVVLPAGDGEVRAVNEAASGLPAANMDDDLSIPSFLVRHERVGPA